MLSANLNKYTVVVDRFANKPEIKSAFEKTFNTQVVSVHVVNKKSRKKPSRTKGRVTTVPGFKKAVVTLKAGQKLELI